ncbi:MAG: hypothetical protein Crog4KO_23800 [Crocinitomicaceae bacterium]
MQLVNKKISNVRYYHINSDEHPFYFREHDCFDLGINIAFEDGDYMHVGWSENDRMELHPRPYSPESRLNNIHTTDATRDWSQCIGQPITGIEVSYVSKEWDIPESCTLRFENGKFVTIVLSEDVEHPANLPQTLQYDDPPLIYVFLNREPPPVTPVRLTIPKYLKGQTEKRETVNLFTIRGLGFILILLAIVLSIGYYLMTE